MQEIDWQRIYQELVKIFGSKQCPQSQIKKGQEFNLRVRQQKEKSQKLIYFIKLIKNSFISKQIVIQQLNKCIKCISTVLKFSKNMRIGNFYHLYEKVLKRYKNLFFYENSAYFQSYSNPTLMDSQEYTYLKTIINEEIMGIEILEKDSKQINQYFININRDQVNIQNTRNICCSPIFIRGSIIKDSNRKFGVVLGISPNQVFQKVILQKYLNSVCNQGGGIIIVGGQNKKTGVLICGIDIKHQYEILNMQNNINTALKQINPPSKILVERVLIKNNYFDRIEHQISQQIRICFRIKILPYDSSKLNYLKILGKNSHFVYEAYKLNKELNPFKLNYEEIKGQESSLDLYTFIHSKYNKKQIHQDCHRLIGCYKTQEFQLLNPAITINNFKQPLQKVQFGASFQYESQTNLEKIFFKYKYSSILIVSSIQDEREILSFHQGLLASKFQVDLIKKPYSKYFKSQMRSIWILSHQINFVPLRKVLKKFEKTKSIQSGVITMLPLFQNLQIQSSRITIENLYYLSNKFSRYFKSSYSVTQNLRIYSGQNKKMTCFHFENINESLLGYMILEELELRPYTFKDQNKV